MADFHCRATAHVGLLDYGNPELGETVLVNGAAGAIGSTAGQIAKIQVRPVKVFINPPLAPGGLITMIKLL